jgi:hypothetical protein
MGAGMTAARWVYLPVAGWGTVRPAEADGEDEGACATTGATDIVWPLEVAATATATAAADANAGAAAGGRAAGDGTGSGRWDRGLGAVALGRENEGDQHWMDAEVD